ncbi:hypothetical protein NDU88_002274 [Pleurodeles waltl]|uniref:Secreted protein n=1 Tax=Pleurodeles waltl TaxID=8319 RepID=A0AAV7T1W8_PLEWA|nr:hypothetical protein NDU88_002274 [Pleurodeles waltl]
MSRTCMRIQKWTLTLWFFSSTVTAIKAERAELLSSVSLATDTLRRLTRLPLASHVHLLSNAHAVEIDAASASVS